MYRIITNTKHIVFVIEFLNESFTIAPAVLAPVSGTVDDQLIDPEKITSPEVKRLYVRLSKMQESRDLLANHIKFLSRSKETFYVFSGRNKIESLKIVCSDKTDLSFEPFVAPNGDFVLKPTISFESTTGEKSFLLKKKALITSKNAKIMIIPDIEGNRIFTKLNPAEIKYNS